MENLTAEIGKITTLLEDAYETQDWKLVKKMIDALDSLYNRLERADNGFDYDYED